MSSRERPKIPPTLALGLSVLTVSFSSILTRYAQQNAPSLAIAAYRLLFASLILWPLLLTWRRAELASINRRQLLLSLTAGGFLALHFASWITSLEYTTVASSIVLVSMAPLFVALAAPFLLGEPLTRRILLGLLIAFAGSGIIALADICQLRPQAACSPVGALFQGRAWLGNLLALIGAATVAGYVIIGRALRRDLDLLTYISLTYGAAALLLIAAMLAAGQPAFGYPPQTYGWFLLLALFPQLLSHSTYNWALRYLPAAFVSVALLGEPIGSSLLAFLLLGERPGALILIGGCLVLGGILIVARRSN